MKNKIFRTMSLVIAVLLLLGLGITGHEAHAQEPDLYIVDTTEDLRDRVQNGVCSANIPSDGPCSLRAAIYEAARYTGGKITIEVPPGVYKLTLTEPSSEGEPEDHYGNLDFPDIAVGSTDITIIGTGDWDNPSVIDANFIDRVMQIGERQKIRLENLVLKNGLAMSDDDRRGGGLNILNATVTLLHVRLTNNESPETSTSTSPSNGGGIFSWNSQLSLLYCELDHNKALEGSAYIGGFDRGITSIWASTIHHNTVNLESGSHIIPGTDMLIINSTISDNQGGRYNIETRKDYSLIIKNSTIISRGELGIVDNKSDKLTLRFNILQVIPTLGVVSGKVCDMPEGYEPSYGGNFFSDYSCNPKVDEDKDIVIQYSDMLLGPLANYGGWTPTVPLLSRQGQKSPAVNFGSGRCPGLTSDSYLEKDQRDKDRDPWCDSGSFELQFGEIPTVVYLPLIIK